MINDIQNEINSKLSCNSEFNKILNLYYILIDSDIISSINFNLDFLI